MFNVLMVKLICYRCRMTDNIKYGTIQYTNLCYTKLVEHQMWSDIRRRFCCYFLPESNCKKTLKIGRTFGQVPSYEQIMSCVIQYNVYTTEIMHET